MGNFEKITVLVPVYNEENTLLKILEKIENTDFCGLEKEIIFIDDASKDKSTEILKTLEDKYKVYYHLKNMGKGAALKTGFSKMTGDIVIVQDADLEYNPADYKDLVQAIIDDKVDVAYGSRFINLNLEAFMLPNLLGNKFITTVFNIFFNTHFTDVETCYKAFNAKFLEGVDIKSTSFDFEPEITAKMIKKKVRIQEFPISYVGRKYHEGKKVSWVDAIHAVNAIIKFRFFN